MSQRTARDSRVGVEVVVQVQVVHAVTVRIADASAAQRRLGAEDTDEVFRYTPDVEPKTLGMQPVLTGVTLKSQQEFSIDRTETHHCSIVPDESSATPQMHRVFP